MRKLKLGAIITLAAVGLSVMFASTALATPSKTTRCSGCHSGVNIPITATLVSTSGTTATYSVTASGAQYISVFNGTVKITQVTGQSGTFSVATGTTYTLYAVKGPSTSSGLGTTTISPVAAPPADTVAPVTTSNAVASYVSMAAITLAATDSGSGVAATYYRLDGGAQVAGTSVVTSALGSHTLQFWSVDKSGNTEAAKTVNFTVTAPVPVDATAPVTTSDAKASYVSSAALKLTATDSGSGVAATYYRLDGGAQVAGTTCSTSALGAHTLQFWSVDVAGNTEAAKTVNFAVTAPVPPTGEVSASKVTIAASSAYVRARRGVTLRGELTPASGGEVVSLYVLRPGASVWSLLSVRGTVLDSYSVFESDDHYEAGESDDDSEAGESASAVDTTADWSYRFSTRTKGTYRFQARFAGDADSAPSVSSIVSVRVR